jgi:hypothetical protein
MPGAKTAPGIPEIQHFQLPAEHHFQLPAEHHFRLWPDTTLSDCGRTPRPPQTPPASYHF